MFKNISNLASLMRQAQQMGGQMQEMAGKLRKQRVTGSAGGGMVEVEANGVGEVLKVRIDPSLDDREMIEDLLPAAVNQALGKAKELHVESMQSMTEGLEIPGLNDAISQLTNGTPADDEPRE
jgi:hypothetical protein